MISEAAFMVAILGREASTTLMPWGANTDAERDYLLQVNARRKNAAGYCAFLGCWQNVSDKLFCSVHGEANGDRLDALQAAPEVVLRGDGAT